MEYSIIENNVVSNIVVSETKMYDNWVEGRYPIGATYDPILGKVVEELPITLPKIPPKVDVITYKLLFTSAERIATKNSTDPIIIDLQELMNDPRTQNVDLNLKSVQNALDYMTSIGILAEGRKDAILTGTPL